MPNPLKLPSDFDQYNYTNLSRSEKNPKNKVRLLAMANIKAGMTLKSIAAVLNVHWKTIQQWLYRFRKEGISGLYVRSTKEKPTKLGADIEKWISQFIIERQLSLWKPIFFVMYRTLTTLIISEFIRR